MFRHNKYAAPGPKRTVVDTAKNQAERVSSMIVPTEKTALLAGALSAIGLVPVEMWMDRKHLPVIESNLIWLLAISLFVLLPMIYLVVGKQRGSFSRLWFLDPDEREGYAEVVKQMLYWFFSAAVIGAIWSFLLSIALR